MKEITASAIALVTAPAMKTKLGTDGKVAFDRWDSRPVFFLHFKDGSKLVLTTTRTHNSRLLSISERLTFSDCKAGVSPAITPASNVTSAR